MAGDFGKWLGISDTKMLERKDISVKRKLVRILMELEEIVEYVEKAKDYPFFNATISPNDVRLTNIEIAILSLEDRYFFSHSGLELKAIPRLFKRYFRTRSLGGISTIEQQLVRLATGRYERTFQRKSRELILAYLLQYHCSKKHLLYCYLSNSYFGETLNGVDAPSRLIFGKESKDLTWEESCLIASFLPYPLPRFAIREFFEINNVFSSPNDIFSYPPFQKSHWILRVKQRYLYALDRGIIPSNRFKT